MSFSSISFKFVSNFFTFSSYSFILLSFSRIIKFEFGDFIFLLLIDITSPFWTCLSSYFTFLFFIFIYFLPSLEFCSLEFNDIFLLLLLFLLLTWSSSSSSYSSSSFTFELSDLSFSEFFDFFKESSLIILFYLI